MRYYYLPISAFVFPEVVGAEAVFPSDCDVTGVFIGRSSYPTTTTGKIPVNPTGKALILYSAPVTWSYRDGPSMDYPLVIEIPETWIDNAILTKLSLASLPDGISAWAYSGTIFFNRETAMRYIFRTEAEKRQRIDSLLLFSEIKDLGCLETACISFERVGLPVEELPDAIGDEIRSAVLSLEITSSRYEADLVNETRCGACLGHMIARASGEPSATISLEDGLKIIPVGRQEEAREIFEEVMGKLKHLETILSDSAEGEYAVLPISVRTAFKFKGRDCRKLWSHLDSRIQKCVDFIANYPLTDWNWYGDEERYKFMRELWNQVLQPSLSTSQKSAIETLREEMTLICRHFKNPNSVEFSFDAIKSPLLQAFCIVLDCPRDSEKLKQCLKHARRSDWCLSVFGALRGFAYFTRDLFPFSNNINPTVVQVPRQPATKPIAKIYSGVESKDDSRKSPLKTVLKTPDVPSWVPRLFDVLKDVFAACKTTPKNQKQLEESFCLAAQECGSEDKLLETLPKKKGWRRNSNVYKKFQKMSERISVQKEKLDENQFEQGELFVPPAKAGEEQSS